jgi:hypothetical protein
MTKGPYNSKDPTFQIEYSVSIFESVHCSNVKRRKITYELGYWQKLRSPNKKSQNLLRSSRGVFNEVVIYDISILIYL